jgi:uncharacterized sulfatase
MKAAILLVLLLLTAGAGSLCGADKAAQPNILLIISDDQGWGDFGFMGHPQICTPNLDELAAQSLTFHRGYTPVPLCRPSLASIATGLYPHQHGVTGNDPDLPDKKANSMASRGDPKYASYYNKITSNFERRPNLIRDLTARGYVSFQTGKWWEGDPVKTAGFSQAMTAGEGKEDRHGGAGLKIGRQGLDPIYQFIERAGDKPWLAWYAPMLPHAPHTPPQDLLEKYRKLAPSEAVARYWACVEWFDRSCGELIAHLEKTGQRANTIIVFTTDNGWLQDPAKVNVHAGRSKLTPYEGGIRTPIMICWPGKVAPRSDKQHLASNLDLWPTLAALLQTPVPSALPGINLTDSRAVTARECLFGEQYAHNIADVDQPTRSLESRWIIDGWWKLIVSSKAEGPGAKLGLYDLQNDPWEKADLSNQEGTRVQALRTKLDAWWQPPSQ